MHIHSRNGKRKRPNLSSIVVTEDRPTEILPHLFICKTGDPLLDDVERLVSSNFTYVVNCGEVTKLEATRREGYALNNDIHPLVLHLKDETNQDLSTTFSFVLPMIHRSKQENQKCLIHCRNCMSRAIAIAVAYLISVENMTLIEALDHVKNRRAFVSPNSGFMEQLIRLEHQVYSKTAISRAKLPSVDINLYKQNRFGETWEYAARRMRSVLQDEECNSESPDDSFLLPAWKLKSAATALCLNATAAIIKMETPLIQDFGVMLRSLLCG